MERPPAKRQRLDVSNTTPRPISPPPLRRNKLATSQTPPPTTPLPRPSWSSRNKPSLTSGKENFEIISWNVNGVGAFLMNPKTSPKITSFFSRSTSASASTSSKSKPKAVSKFTNEPEPEPERRKSPLRMFLRRHGWPQMLCLQEVKINPKDEKTRRDLERAANFGGGGVEGEEEEGAVKGERRMWGGGGRRTEKEPGYTAYFSLPRDKYNAKGFGGKVHGVCTLLRDDVLEEEDEGEEEEEKEKEKGKEGGGKVVTREVEWDLEGRVLVTEFPQWKLAVVNGYWVNGTLAPYRHSQTGEVIGTRHDRKRKFQRLMRAEAKGFEDRGGWEVVLVGDMNVARSLLDGYPGVRMGEEHVRNRREFNELFFEKGNEEKGGMRGVDTFRYIHGEKRMFTYHGERAEEWGRSCDRVDLGIVSSGVVERGALIGAEIWESVEERGHSDHVPLSVVLNIEKLIGSS